MKFKTTSKEIKNFVLSVSRAIDIKPSNPALQGIYLRAENGLCELIGTDLDLVIKAKFPVEVLVDGESLINSRVFSEVVRKLPVGEVVFSDLGSEIKIETKKTEYKNLDKNSNEFEKYEAKARLNLINKIYQSYDESVNQKYKVELNQRTIERVKNSFQ